MSRRFRSGKRTIYRRVVPMLTAATVGLGLLGGCADASSDTSENRRQIVDDFAPVILLLDSGSAMWDETLETVGRYAESGTEEDLLEALIALTDAYEEVETMEVLAEQYASVEPTEEYLEFLEAEGISAQDYQILMATPDTVLQSYYLHLYSLDYYIISLYEGADILWDTFVFNCEILTENQTYERQYGWFAYVNYWFAEWEGEDLDYVQEQILDNLVSLNADGLDWDTSRDSIETRINAVLDNIESITVRWEEQVESEEDALEEMEKELEQAKEAAGN